MIHVIYDKKPVATRDLDWRAFDDETYDGVGPIGYAATMLGAVAALVIDMDQYKEVNEECRLIQRGLVLISPSGS
jgi:hypothetical protein